MAPRRHHSARIPANETAQFLKTSTLSSPSRLKRHALHKSPFVDSQRVQFVDGLVLVGPLQVELDLSDQWKTVGVGYVQFLHFINAIFLQKTKKMGL